LPPLRPTPHSSTPPRLLTPLPLFFSTHTPTPPIYTLSLHDALPISPMVTGRVGHVDHRVALFPRTPFLLEEDPGRIEQMGRGKRDRKSTRLNSSHQIISYAVFCLKKKKKKKTERI